MSSQLDENIQYTDPTTRELLNNGYIYIGTNGLDAKLNLITIYSDRALATPISNPQRTGSDGRAVNKIWIPGKYSMKVEDSANVQKLNDLDLGDLEQIGNTILSNAQGINDITATGSPTVTALIDKQTYIYTAPAANTGAMTLTIDGTPTWPIKKEHDVAIASGDFEQNQIIMVAFNETDSTYELVSFPANAPYVGLIGDESIAGEKTFTSTAYLSSAVPVLRIIESDASAENKKWDILANNETFILQTINDAEDASVRALEITRTGTTVDTVNFPNGVLQTAGNPVWDDSGANGPAAVSGYTKDGSGIYHETSGSLSYTVLTFNALTAIAAPTGATGVMLQVVFDVQSANATGARYARLYAYSNSGGTNIINEVIHDSYEQAAIAATRISAVNPEIFIPVVSGNVYVKFYLRDPGGNSTIKVRVIGYTI